MLKFRTPWYLGDKFAGFQYWEFEHGQVKLIGDYWEPWVSKQDILTAKPDEQCTGLKDKNGDLIYIGDTIKCVNDIFGTITVEYANDENFIDGIYPFDLYHDCGDECHCRLRDYPEYACEIIGNVHEQIEQKDEQ